MPLTVHAPGDDALGSDTVDVSVPRYGSNVSRLTGVAAAASAPPVPTRSTVMPVAGTLFVGVCEGVGVDVGVLVGVPVRVADGDGDDVPVGGGVPPMLPDADGVSDGVGDAEPVPDGDVVRVAECDGV